MKYFPCLPQFNRAFCSLVFPHLKGSFGLNFFIFTMLSIIHVEAVAEEESISYDLLSQYSDYEKAYDKFKAAGQSLKAEKIRKKQQLLLKSALKEKTIYNIGKNCSSSYKTENSEQWYDFLATCHSDKAKSTPRYSRAWAENHFEEALEFRMELYLSKKTLEKFQDFVAGIRAKDTEKSDVGAMNLVIRTRKCRSMIESKQFFVIDDYSGYETWKLCGELISFGERSEKEDSGATYELNGTTFDVFPYEAQSFEDADGICKAKSMSVASLAETLTFAKFSKQIEWAEAQSRAYLTSTRDENDPEKILQLDAFSADRAVEAFPENTPLEKRIRKIRSDRKTIEQYFFCVRQKNGAKQ